MGDKKIPKNWQCILDEALISKAVSRISYEILEKEKNNSKLAIIGIRTAGEYLAKRIHSRIQEIEGKLSFAQIIDPSVMDAGGKVVFGSTIELEDEDTGDKVTYQIVGEDEADIKFGRINISSPIARALIGKDEGDTAEVQAPGGIKRYEIIAVMYL